MKRISLMAVLAFSLLTGQSLAGELNLIAHEQGSYSLSQCGDYDWWYGCSPTSAGMMMSYYDHNGYDNLVPGGVAELNTFGTSAYLVNNIIASSGHINDFYRSGYQASGDDLADAPTHSLDCLADFMGTSQDAYGNSNGATTFWFYGDGDRLYSWQIETLSSSYYNDSGMYGIYEYVEYAGYEVASAYNQYIYGYNGNTLGFTFADYVSEINAGRPVLIHIEGHSMFGYGYDLNTNEVLLHDTWSSGEHRMVWGSTYQDDGTHYGVTTLEILVPEPCSLVLLGLGGLLLRRKSI